MKEGMYGAIRPYALETVCNLCVVKTTDLSKEIIAFNRVPRSPQIPTVLNRLFYRRFLEFFSFDFTFSRLNFFSLHFFVNDSQNGQGYDLENNEKNHCSEVFFWCVQKFD